MPNFKKLKDEVENGTLAVRRTRTKVAIWGQYHDGDGEGLQIVKKRKGLEIKWYGHVRVDAAETLKCDMGHDHRVVKNKHWVWNYCTLTPSDAKSLIEFLSEHT